MKRKFTSTLEYQNNSVKIKVLYQSLVYSLDHLHLQREHPFKTSPFFRGGGVNNLPNLPTDSSKKLPTVGG